MIPFNKPYLTGQEIPTIHSACLLGHLSGDGRFTKACSSLLEKRFDINKVLLTHSCTAALEMVALLLRLKEGDEIILPSYTFVSTANAFVLRGATPVFVDIRKDTLNINECLVERAINSKTKAIVVVHYAGISCEMDKLRSIAKEHGLALIEDAAQALGSLYKEKPLGSIGDLATFSFHETKNIISGEGGALAINNLSYYHRSEILREKGTNRSRFLRGEVDKYTWTDIGSSFLPSELNAAFLYPQILSIDEILKKRKAIWECYHSCFEGLELDGRIKRPFIPENCTQNYHMYYLRLRDLDDRCRFIQHMKSAGVQCVFHYIPLHSSPMGRAISKVVGDMTVTDNISDCLVRLPFWIGINPHLEYICKTALAYFNN